MEDLKDYLKVTWPFWLGIVIIFVMEMVTRA